MRVMRVGNAFSLGMIDGSCSIDIDEVELEEARTLCRAGVESCVGHADTAGLFTALLGTEVPMARVTVRLSAGDRILVGQLAGPRLPEGATELPEGASIRWLLVSVFGPRPCSVRM